MRGATARMSGEEDVGEKVGVEWVDGEGVGVGVVEEEGEEEGKEERREWKSGSRWRGEPALPGGWVERGVAEGERGIAPVME